MVQKHNDTYICERVNESHISLLTGFFSAMKKNKDELYFHPHPFTRQQAEWIAYEADKDLYFIAHNTHIVFAYGMLRGWNEGYEIPSLGIAVHPDYRGCGYGKIMMNYLHKAAKEEGAPKIRLKVEKDNTIAAELYRSLGYEFTGEEDSQLVGYYTF